MLLHLSKTLALHPLTRTWVPCIQEASVDISVSQREASREMHAIVLSLRRQDLAPVKQCVTYDATNNSRAGGAAFAGMI
jgi:hypothetical protein